MDNILLKPLDEEHLEWARLLHNDPSVLDMLTDPHVVSPEEQLRWFDKLQNSSSSRRLVAFVANSPVGVVRLDQIDYHNKSICVGLDIHREHRGLGYAKKIYKQVFREWFMENNFNRVWLLVAGYNQRALHIYRSLGFVEEGVQRQGLFKKGKYRDYVMMSILRDEYVKEYVNE
jgi:RimJ/RimL family protein N-acetyltransferase